MPEENTTTTRHAEPEGPRHSSWDYPLAIALGGILLLVGWVDAHAYLAGLDKPRRTYAFNDLPGGMVVGPSQEFFRSPDGEYASLENFAQLEVSGRHFFRHGLGPVSTVRVFSQKPTAQLRFRYASEVPDQNLTVACNDHVLEQMTRLPTGEIVRTYALRLLPGDNRVTFSYSHYYHDGTNNLEDARPVAGSFWSFELLVP